MKKIIPIFSTPVILFSLFLAFAIGPSVSEKEFPSHNVIHFSENPRALKNSTLTLATYNIGYASGVKNNKGSILTKKEVLHNLDELALAIQKMNSDVIGLQEVDFKSYRSFNINQLLYLNQKLSYPYAAYVVTWNKKYVAWPYWPFSRHFKSVLSGQAVLSRYPIEEHDLLHFKKPRDNAFWYNWFYLDRIAQKLTLNYHGKKMIIWNVHLEAFKKEARNEQARILADEIMSHSYEGVDLVIARRRRRSPEGIPSGQSRLIKPGSPRDQRSLAMTQTDFHHGNNETTFVLGDFNSVSAYSENLKPDEILKMEEDEKALQIILSTTNFYNAEGSEKIFTMPSWNPIKKIDHILFNDSVKLIEMGNLNLTASDHLPVWAKFVISNER